MKKKGKVTKKYINVSDLMMRVEKNLEMIQFEDEIRKEPRDELDVSDLRMRGKNKLDLSTESPKHS